MEDKINKIWYQMNMKEITSEQARQQVLDLFAVSRRSEQVNCIHKTSRLRIIGRNLICLDCKTTWRQLT